MELLKSLKILNKWNSKLTLQCFQYHNLSLSYVSIYLSQSFNAYFKKKLLFFLIGCILHEPHFLFLFLLELDVINMENIWKSVSYLCFLSQYIHLFLFYFESISSKDHWLHHFLSVSHHTLSHQNFQLTYTISHFF